MTWDNVKWKTGAKKSQKEFEIKSFILIQFLFNTVQLSTLFCTKILDKPSFIQQNFSTNLYNTVILLKEV